MPLNLKSLLSTTAALVNRNNTTTATYNISSNLKKPVQRVYIGTEGMHDKLPIPLEVYPVVFVELGSKQEIMKRMGNSANRDVELNLHFVGITNYGAGSADEAVGRQNACLECITLMNNIEYLLRNKETLSLTVQMCNVENTVYGSNREGTYNVVGDITAKILITDTD